MLVILTFYAQLNAYLFIIVYELENSTTCAFLKTCCKSGKKYSQTILELPEIQGVLDKILTQNNGVTRPKQGRQSRHPMNHHDVGFLMASFSHPSKPQEYSKFVGKIPEQGGFAPRSQKGQRSTNPHHTSSCRTPSGTLTQGFYKTCMPCNFWPSVKDKHIQGLLRNPEARMILGTPRLQIKNRN